MYKKTCAWCKKKFKTFQSRAMCCCVECNYQKNLKKAIEKRREAKAGKKLEKVVSEVYVPDYKAETVKLKELGE